MITEWPETPIATEVKDRSLFRRALIVAPPSVQGSVWTRRFGDFSDAFASGWMMLRGARRRRSIDRGFVLSDHADWPGLQRALAEGAGIDAKRVAQRMMGYTDKRATPTAERYAQLTAAGEGGPLELGQPYPFFLAHPLDFAEAELAARLGAPADWIVEWKYDGIRAQIVKRAREVWIWSCLLYTSDAADE